MSGPRTGLYFFATKIIGECRFFCNLPIKIIFNFCHPQFTGEVEILSPPSDADIGMEVNGFNMIAEGDRVNGAAVPRTTGWESLIWCTTTSIAASQLAALPPPPASRPIILAQVWLPAQIFAAEIFQKKIQLSISQVFLFRFVSA